MNHKRLSHSSGLARLQARCCLAILAILLAGVQSTCVSHPTEVASPTPPPTHTAEPTPTPRLPRGVPASAQTGSAEGTIIEDFVGDYVMHEIRGQWIIRLSIRPDLTFEAILWTDVGEIGDQGRIFANTDRVWVVSMIHWETGFSPKTPAPREVPKLSYVLIPLRWGTYRLLIPEPNVPVFCSELASDPQPSPYSGCNCDKCNCLCFVDRSYEPGAPVEGWPSYLDGTPVCR